MWERECVWERVWERESLGKRVCWRERERVGDSVGEIALERECGRA